MADDLPRSPITNCRDNPKTCERLELEETVINGGLLSHAGGLTACFSYYDRTDTGMLMYYAWKGNGSLGDLPERQLDPATSYTGILTSADGEAWHGPISRIDGGFPNWAPSALADGRLLMPGNAGVAWTDDPAGMDGWQRSTLPRIDPGETDDPEGFIVACRNRGDSHNHCESSAFQTDDGVIHRLMRTGQGWLSVSESRDRGETWSEPVPTDYTDVSSKHIFGRLPDGRFYGLSSPQPSSPRTPLVLAVSEDGVRFDRHWVVGDAPNQLARLPGMHKYGRYGYPHLCLADDQVCIIYSMAKEDILFVRFPLANLS
ncbi:MAG: exo-alpha-sialidase [Opitutales bacterium]